MPSIGPMELLVVLVIALLVLGPKRLPATGRSLGRGIQEFKAGLTTGGETPAEAAAQPTDSAAQAQPDPVAGSQPPARVST